MEHIVRLWREIYTQRRSGLRIFDKRLNENVPSMLAESKQLVIGLLNIYSKVEGKERVAEIREKEMVRKWIEGDEEVMERMGEEAIKVKVEGRRIAEGVTGSVMNEGEGEGRQTIYSKWNAMK
jgi:hypothetical protein